MEESGMELECFRYEDTGRDRYRDHEIYLT